jgi:hypothetical protein
MSTPPAIGTPPMYVSSSPGNGPGGPGGSANTVTDATKSKIKINNAKAIDFFIIVVMFVCLIL